jgi:hypothetical protein
MSTPDRAVAIIEAGIGRGYWIDLRRQAGEPDGSETSIAVVARC